MRHSGAGPCRWEDIRDEGLRVLRAGGFQSLRGQTGRKGGAGYVSVGTAEYSDGDWHHLILYDPELVPSPAMYFSPW